MAKPRSVEGLPAPNWKFWTRREEWNVTDGAVLLVDLEPRSKPGLRIKTAIALRDIEHSADPLQHARRASGDFTDTRITDSEAPLFLRALDIYTNAWAAIRRGNLAGRNGIVEPREFLTWAQGKEYGIPPSLEDASTEEQEEEIAKRWRTTQLWTLMETAHLFSGVEPQANVVPDTLKGAVAVWYRDLKDAITLAQIRSLSSRSPGVSNLLLKPPEVAAWALDHDRKVPRWISEIAPAQPSRAELIACIEDLKRRLNAAAPQEKPLLTRERETALKLIIGMAIGRYGYDPSATRSTVTAEIADELDKRGLLIDVDTVRKWLREGAELLPQNGSRN